jgi:hypothetical protein
MGIFIEFDELKEALFTTSANSRWCYLWNIELVDGS